MRRAHRSSRRKTARQPVSRQMNRTTTITRPSACPAGSEFAFGVVSLDCKQSGLTLRSRLSRQLKYFNCVGIVASEVFSNMSIRTLIVAILALSTIAFGQPGNIPAAQNPGVLIDAFQVHTFANVTPPAGVSF